MKRLYSVLKIKVRFLATLMLCLAAVYVVAGRYLFTQLPEYKQDVAAILSLNLGRPVTLQSIEGYWSGFDPLIRLNQLNVGGERPIEIEAISIRPGLLRSIMAGALRLRSLEFLNTSFDAVQSPGSWELAGYPLSASSGEESAVDDKIIRDALQGTNISFIETSIQVFSNRGDQREWRLPSISLRYQGDDVYASGQVVQPGSLSPLMSISFHGDRVLSDQPVKGEIYLEARSVDFLDAVLSVYNWQGLSVNGIDASGRIWADFEDFKLLDLQGEIQASRVDWAVNEVQQEPVKNLVAQFAWQRTGSSQQLALNNLAWQWQELNCMSSNGLLDHEQDTDAQRTNIYLDKLDLACINSMLLSSDLPQGRLFDRLEISQPKGWLEHVYVTINAQTNALNAAQETAPNADAGQNTQAQSTNMAVRKQKGNPSASAAIQKDAGPDSDSRGAMTVAATDSTLSEQAPSVVDEEGAEQTEIAEAPDTLALSEPVFSLEANLRDVSLSAYETTPSAKGISGYLYADENSGHVDLQSHDFVLGFPTLFLDSWDTDYAQGSVYWQMTEDDIDVFSRGLQLVLPKGGLVYGDFLLRLNPVEHEDYLGLAIALQDIPFEEVTRFVPFYEVETDLYEWLQSALQSGTVEHGVFLGYGSVEEDDSVNSFTSSLRVDVSDGELKFDPEWPPLKHLDAHIELQDDQLLVEADKAAIHDTDLFGLVVNMPTAEAGQDPVLHARAKALTQGSNLDYWISESPVAKHTRALSEALSIEGGLEVDIDISVPMGDEDIRYQVDTAFKGNRIEHLLSGLIFSDMQGFVRVDSSQGVNAEGVKLSLFDQSGTLQIFSLPEANERTQSKTRILLESRSGINDLLGHFGIEPVQGLHGDLAYQASLDIFDAKDKAPELRVVSDLVGLERKWPRPYAKLAQQSESLTIDVRFEAQQTMVNADLKSEFAGRVDANLLFNEQSLSAVDLLLGDLSSRGYENPIADGLRIHGVILDVDLEEWIDFSDQAKAGASDKDPSIAINSIDLGIASLSAFGQSFSNLTLAMKPQETGWRAQVLSKALAGDIFLPDETRSLSLNLDHIHLKTETSESAAAQETETEVADEQQVNPRDIPALAFATKSLIVDDQDYGSWSAITVPEPTGVRLQKLKGELGGMRLEGQLNWTQEEMDRTFLELEFSGSDIEPFFQALEKPAPLSSEVFKGEMALIWQAAPYDFSADKLSGSFDMVLKNGFLKTPDNKTGALRLLGIFNADALARRLKLDFSDLYKSGIGYDELTMRSKIDQGTLRFREPMKINGPSSKYEISGSSNLAKRSLDLDMYVELPFSSNVPLAALMLGAPQVGGAVWLVDKLLGEPLSSITSAKYHVKGSWDDPQLELK